MTLHIADGRGYFLLDHKNKIAYQRAGFFCFQLLRPVQELAFVPPSIRKEYAKVPEIWLISKPAMPKIFTPAW